MPKLLLLPATVWEIMWTGGDPTAPPLLNLNDDEKLLFPKKFSLRYIWDPVYLSLTCMYKDGGYISKQHQGHSPKIILDTSKGTLSILYRVTPSKDFKIILAFL